ncbi:hypothetical protein SGLAM104S_08611 [Streptomyces glaucescens]
MVRWWWTNRPTAPVVLATGGKASCAVSLPALQRPPARSTRWTAAGMRLGPVVASPTRWAILVKPYSLEQLGELLYAQDFIPGWLPASTARAATLPCPVRHRAGRGPLGAGAAARLGVALGARRRSRGGRGGRRPHPYGCERARDVGGGRRAPRPAPGAAPAIFPGHAASCRGPCQDVRRARGATALAGVAAACVIALPLAAAQAGTTAGATPGAQDDLRPVLAPEETRLAVSVGPGMPRPGTAPWTARPPRPRTPGAAGSPGADPGSGTRSSPSLLGIGLSTAARCGPALPPRPTASRRRPACRRRARRTGRAPTTATPPARPGPRTDPHRAGRAHRAEPLRGRARDEPASCETPRETGRSPAGYTAVAEFAGRGGGDGGLLLGQGAMPCRGRATPRRERGTPR